MRLLRHDLYIEPVKAFIDPPFPVDRAIITHGHADHARWGHKHVLATPDTIGIMKQRYGEDCAESFQPVGYGETIVMGDVCITLYPAGHILGSAQVLLEWKGCRIVVSGDYKRYADGTCTPFEPVQCDIFVTEATFGLPVFQHPPPQTEIEKLLHSVKSFPERSHVLGCYALGKTQRLINLLREAGYDAPIYMHGALFGCSDYYQEHGVDLGDLRKATGVPRDIFKGAIVLAPPSALQEPWARRLADPIIGMASGWMMVKQRVRQRGVEMPLVISDHADWNELQDTIKDTGAGEIWVTHGREDALVYWCESQGLKAAPLHLQGREDEEE
ncbi:MAG: ligase-associated DNA damage response exonuclease [Micavibrio aeruginosavorus]|uniref:Ligase-associated DNA damage response exonuclease n=1 Tax=Micavibrio aeruginosavorus TaxID=349221 RepID=A0A2W5FLQ8_9BACT|nr:MAG: ligase-associated DNA damage response exonuclease [Micavibrio aeruginosavorus]